MSYKQAQLWHRYYGFHPVWYVDVYREILLQASVSVLDLARPVIVTSIPSHCYWPLIPTNERCALAACALMSATFVIKSVNPQYGSWYLSGWERQGQQAFIENARWFPGVRLMLYSSPRLVVQITARHSRVFRKRWSVATRKKATNKKTKTSKQTTREECRAVTSLTLYNKTTSHYHSELHSWHAIFGRNSSLRVYILTSWSVIPAFSKFLIPCKRKFRWKWNKTK